MTSCAALACATLKVELEALVNPLALACSCLPEPAVSIRKSVNVTVPLPLAVPMSSVVVPCNGPVPDWSVIKTGRLEPMPAVDALPYGS